jgi:hypothetical protein
MKPRESSDLLEVLDNTGDIELSSLVVRAGENIPDVISQLRALEQDGLVSIDGNTEAVQELANKIDELKELIGSGEFESALYAALGENEEAGEARVSVTKSGFLKSLRMRSAGVS